MYKPKMKPGQYKHCLAELEDNDFEKFCFDANPSGAGAGPGAGGGAMGGGRSGEGGEGGDVTIEM